MGRPLLFPKNWGASLVSLGIVRLKTKEPGGNVHSLQRIPQYVEVPPNIEAKRIISYFSNVLSY